MKTETKQKLIDLLKILKKERITEKFCEEYHYESTYLSKVLNGKNNGSCYFHRVIISDIEEFLKKGKENT